MASPATNHIPSWLWVEMGCMPYPEALDWQRNLVRAKIEGELAYDLWLILEHPSVYTLGRGGDRQNLTVSESFLKTQQIPIIHVERGGDITYHGPGQIVGYPIIDMRRAKLGVSSYVEKLEEVMLRTAAHWGVTGRRDSRNRGLWVGDNKIGSIGISVRRGITFHGFAFNVSPSLTPFEWINPCGLKGVGVTSLAAEGVTDVDLASVRDILRTEAAEIFGVTFKRTNPQELETWGAIAAK